MYFEYLKQVGQEFVNCAERTNISTNCKMSRNPEDRFEKGCGKESHKAGGRISKGNGSSTDIESRKKILDGLSSEGEQSTASDCWHIRELTSCPSCEASISGSKEALRLTNDRNKIFSFLQKLTSDELPLEDSELEFLRKFIGKTIENQKNNAKRKQTVPKADDYYNNSTVSSDILNSNGTKSLEIGSSAGLSRNDSSFLTDNMKEIFLPPKNTIKNTADRDRRVHLSLKEKGDLITSARSDAFSTRSYKGDDLVNLVKLDCYHLMRTERQNKIKDLEQQESEEISLNSESNVPSNDLPSFRSFMSLPEMSQEKDTHTEETSAVSECRSLERIEKFRRMTKKIKAVLQSEGMFMDADETDSNEYDNSDLFEQTFSELKQLNSFGLSSDSSCEYVRASKAIRQCTTGQSINIDDIGQMEHPQALIHPDSNELASRTNSTKEDQIINAFQKEKGTVSARTNLPNITTSRTYNIHTKDRREKPLIIDENIDSIDEKLGEFIRNNYSSGSAKRSTDVCLGTGTNSLEVETIWVRPRHTQLNEHDLDSFSSQMDLIHSANSISEEIPSGRTFNIDKKNESLVSSNFVVSPTQHLRDYCKKRSQEVHNYIHHQIPTGRTTTIDSCSSISGNRNEQIFRPTIQSTSSQQSDLASQQLQQKMKTEVYQNKDVENANDKRQQMYPKEPKVVNSTSGKNSVPLRKVNAFLVNDDDRKCNPDLQLSSSRCSGGESPYGPFNEQPEFNLEIGSISSYDSSQSEVFIDEAYNPVKVARNETTDPTITQERGAQAGSTDFLPAEKKQSTVSSNRTYTINKINGSHSGSSNPYYHTTFVTKNLTSSSQIIEEGPTSQRFSLNGSQGSKLHPINETFLLSSGVSSKNYSIPLGTNSEELLDDASSFAFTSPRPRRRRQKFGPSDQYSTEDEIAISTTRTKSSKKSSQRSAKEAARLAHLRKLDEQEKILLQQFEEQLLKERMAHIYSSSSLESVAATSLCDDTKDVKEIHNRCRDVSVSPEVKPSVKPSETPKRDVQPLIEDIQMLCLSNIRRNTELIESVSRIPKIISENI